MNFDFSDDQRMLREQARRFLDDRKALGACRRILEDPSLACDRDLWTGMAELGWLGITIPEKHGGVGLGHEELCVVAEEIGRHLAPVPFSSSVYLATEALLLAGSEAQQAQWLPRLAKGEVVGTFAMAEGDGAVTPATLSTRFEGGRLDGTKLPVPDGLVADFAVVLASSGDGHASLALVPLDGVAREAVDTIDPSRGHARLVFRGIEAEPLGRPGDGWALTDQILDRAAVPMAFEQVGGAEAALQMARDYALERYAFGRPIGSFQAIKHKLADVYMALEIARANALYGAWALASGSGELPVAAAAARVAANQAFNLASSENIQTHGGMGFSWEYDCHLYYRRAKLLALALGSERRWKGRLVTRLESRNAPIDSAA